MIKKEYRKAVVYLQKREIRLEVATATELKMLKESEIFDFLFEEEVKKTNKN